MVRLMVEGYVCPLSVRNTRVMVKLETVKLFEEANRVNFLTFTKLPCAAKLVPSTTPFPFFQMGIITAFIYFHRRFFTGNILEVWLEVHKLCE